MALPCDLAASFISGGSCRVLTFFPVSVCLGATDRSGCHGTSVAAALPHEGPRAWTGTRLCRHRLIAIKALL